MTAAGQAVLAAATALDRERQALLAAWEASGAVAEGVALRRVRRAALDPYVLELRRGARELDAELEPLDRVAALLAR